MPIPVKQFLLIESFHNKNNILRKHNIFGNTELFLKQEGLKTPVWQKSSNFTSLLGNQVDQKSMVQTWKNKLNWKVEKLSLNYLWYIYTT